MLIACCNPVTFAPHDDLVVNVGSRPVPRHSHEPWNSEWSEECFELRSVESTPVHGVFSILTHSSHFAAMTHDANLYYRRVHFHFDDDVSYP